MSNYSKLLCFVSFVKKRLSETVEYSDNGDMKDSRCQICKYIGKSTLDDIYTSQVFRGSEEALKIHLCYLHSWEFFKIGQVKFILKYRHNFLNHYGTEHDNDLIDYVRLQATGN